MFMFLTCCQTWLHLRSAVNGFEITQYETYEGTVGYSSVGVGEVWEPTFELATSPGGLSLSTVVTVRKDSSSWTSEEQHQTTWRKENLLIQPLQRYSSAVAFNGLKKCTSSWKWLNITQTKIRNIYLIQLFSPSEPKHVPVTTNITFK